MQANTAMKATGGRDASRERRERLVQGKTSLPPASERTRNGNRDSAIVRAPAPVAAPSVSAAPAPDKSQAPATAAAAVSAGGALGGRAASRARRAGQVQGKSGLQQFQANIASAEIETVANVAIDAPNTGAPMPGSGRVIAQAMRSARAQNGRGDVAPARPSGRVRSSTPIQYPPKVADTQTYAGKKVTGVRIGRGANMTGDEQGADVQVTGSQYIGKETGFNPREGGVKVGAARTAGGLVVTGTQVRSKVMITGDESNSGIRITGEADQEVADDLLDRREQGAYASMQFQRQNNPHGHTVFGTNLGRSIKSIGSRDRDQERATEQTDGGLPISGTAVGRSQRVTGDEPGSCRPITGSQYLMPGAKQPLCEVAGGKAGARAGAEMGANGRPDPVTGGKVAVSESWTRQRITGVAVEHNPKVSGDEYGACAPITGTPYAGPDQYESFCETGDAAAAAQRATPGLSQGNRVTGDTPRNGGAVTGTQRGGERSLTGTPYYREDVEHSVNGSAVGHLNSRFSVRSPQREAQLQVDAKLVEAPSAELRITGTFAAGEGKITGNQEFHFSPRGRAEHDGSQSRITGEGRMEGPAITGGAWGAQRNVTGTEGYIAAERNPSERAGKRQAFANSTVFKGMGKHESARQNVTGTLGWSAKSAAKVTLSGGAQG